jgi:Holliday junction resolvase RusA-like endonuclease
MTGSVTVYSLTVYGVPVPQGSKRIGRHGNRFVVLESTDRTLRPWRAAVTAAARQAAGPPLAGPLRLRLAFTLPRPKSAPRDRHRPDRRPDLSKLVRAVEDALTDAAAYADDAQIVTVYASKRYVGDPLALPAPGVAIIVSKEPHD